MNIDISLPILMTAIFVGGTAGYLGSLMITKRMTLVGDALGHVALPGMGLALLWGINVSWGAFIFLLIGILLVWFLETRTELPVETLVGIIFVLSLSLGFLIIPNWELLEALIGDISKISFTDAVFSMALSILVLAIVYKIYSRLILASMSEDLAIASRINIKKDNLIYLLAVAMIVALGVKVVGSLLIGALMIVPAAASRNFSRNLRQYSYGGMVIGIISCLLGIIIYKIAGFPAGPIIILTSAAIFLISLIFRRK